MKICVASSGDIPSQWAHGTNIVKHAKGFYDLVHEIINDKLIAVCGGYNFRTISWQDNEVIFNSEDLGELHGIAYNNRLNLLYLVSRSRSLIYIFKIEI